MLTFNDFNKKKEEKKTDYEIVKSRTGLPIFVLEPPDSLSNLTSDDEPVRKKKSISQTVRRVCDYISVHSL